MSTCVSTRKEQLSKLMSTAEGRATLRSRYARRGRGYSFYGANYDFSTSLTNEKILAGPAETGKTFTCLSLLYKLAWQFPNLRAAMVMKTYSVIPITMQQTWETKIMPKGWKEYIHAYGGKKPQWYDFPNGSRIYVGGMDNPDKILGGELDVVCTSQTEQFTEDDWQAITTRVTGRAGNMRNKNGTAYALLFGDANPGPDNHWIIQRSKAGSLELYESRHIDNPVLYDQSTGLITEQGKVTMSTLNKLTGIRRLRLKDGLWVRAEGVVYEQFDRRTHLLTADDIRTVTFDRYVMGIDWGYKHAGVMQIWGMDHDSRMYRLHEVYMSGKQIDWWLGQAAEFADMYDLEAIIYDGARPDYGDTFKDHFETDTCQVIPAYKPILAGIAAVQRRMARSHEDVPYLVFVNGSAELKNGRVVRYGLDEADPVRKDNKQTLCTEDEMGVYSYKKGKDGAIKDELPEKKHDDGSDTMRYVTAYFDELSDAPIEEDLSEYEWGGSGDF